jgi:hypothetical protein
MVGEILFIFYIQKAVLSDRIYSSKNRGQTQNCTLLENGCNYFDEIPVIY